MPNVDINGEVVDFPDSLSADQLNQAVSKAATQIGKKNQKLLIPQSNQTPLQQFGNDLSNSKGILGTTNTLLKAPEKMSRQGLQIISNAIPETVGGPMTGNRGLDVLKGTPKVIAETAKETAPGFISKGAILTAGALKSLQETAPIIKAIMKGAGTQAESISGAMPGSLEAAYKAPMFEPLQMQAGKKIAGPMYSAAKNELPFIVKDAAGLNPFKGMIDNKQIVMKAQELLDAGEDLLPQEAFQARKAADALEGSRSINQDALISLRGQLNSIAKQSENIAEADPAYIKGKMAESLRQVVPQNMHGGASAFKMAIGTALNKMGTTGKILKFGLSPAVQGIGATVAGDVAKIARPLIETPALGTALAGTSGLKKLTEEIVRKFLREHKWNPEKARKAAKGKGYDTEAK